MKFNKGNIIFSIIGLIVGIVSMTIVLQNKKLIKDFISDILPQKKAIKISLDTQKKEIFNKGVGGSNLLIFNTMPKSGSMYISTLISTSTNTEWKSIGNPYFPTSTMDYFEVKKLAIGKTLSLTQQHFNPSSINMQMVQKFCDRMVLHVRHPLQATLSWIHNMDNHHIRGEEDLLYYVAPTPPPELYGWALDQKIDWYIEHYLPALNSWLMEWMDFIENKKSPHFKVLITHFEEFKENEKSFLKKILKFYDINSQSLKHTIPEKSSRLHFRKGKLNEWKKVFSEEQINRAKTKLDPAVLAYFGWTI